VAAPHHRVQVVVINFSEKSAFSLDLSSSGLFGGEQWQLHGHPRANQIFLNGEPLTYDKEKGELPSMHAKPAAYAMQLPPCSVTFVRFAVNHGSD
jgi:hypothetical protein